MTTGTLLRHSFRSTVLESPQKQLRQTTVAADQNRMYTGMNELTYSLEQTIHAAFKNRNQTTRYTDNLIMFIGSRR